MESVLLDEDVHAAMLIAAAAARDGDGDGDGDAVVSTSEDEHLRLRRLVAIQRCAEVPARRFTSRARVGAGAGPGRRRLTGARPCAARWTPACARRRAPTDGSYMQTCGEGKGAVSFSSDGEGGDEDVAGEGGEPEREDGEDEGGDAEALDELDFERLRRLERRVDEAYEFAVRGDAGADDDADPAPDAGAHARPADESARVLQELYLLAAAADETMQAAREDSERLSDSIAADSEAFLGSLREFLNAEVAAEGELRSRFEEGVDAAMEQVRLTHLRPHDSTIIAMRPRHHSLAHSLTRSLTRSIERREGGRSAGPGRQMDHRRATTTARIHSRTPPAEEDGSPLPITPRAR